MNDPAPGETKFTTADVERVKTETGVRGVALFAEVGSTNDTALKHAQNPELATPFLVLAERQTAGRGRGANRWWSADGSLTFSFAVDLGGRGLPAARWPQASLAAGLAIRSSLAAAAPEREFGLKWPNDVHLADRKVSGILVETAPGTAGRMVIGVGINVNNSLAAAPEELRKGATSIADATGRRFDRTAILIATLNEIQTRLELLSRRMPLLVEEWRRHCLLEGQNVELRAGSRTVAGRCRGIDDDGALVVETSQGVERFVGGVVERVRAAGGRDQG